MIAAKAPEIQVEVYPMWNRRTLTGYPLRWRTRNPNTGRVKSYASKDAALAAVAHVPAAAIKVWDHVRR